jgi:uncharacterized BrkB/YihY/UPF0761 family membrane protein
MNPVERVARGFDDWQQRHPVIGFPVAVAKKFGDDQAGFLVSLLAYYAFVAVFPLLLVLAAVTGVVLRDHPRLQKELLDSAFAEFPIIGGQIHQQLGLAAFGHTTLSLTVGILGALYGARGFANALQNTLNTLWAVPKVDRPGFPQNYLRAMAALLALGLLVVVSAASSASAELAESWGFSGLPARIISLFVGSLSSAAGVIVSHQLRHAQAIAGFFGVVLGLLGWLALQATVIVYAIEADVVRAKSLWPRTLVQPPLTQADEKYYTSALKAETRRPEQYVDVAYSSEVQDAEPSGDDQTEP